MSKTNYPCIGGPKDGAEFSKDSIGNLSVIYLKPFPQDDLTIYLTPKGSSKAIYKVDNKNERLVFKGYTKNDQ